MIDSLILDALLLLIIILLVPIGVYRGGIREGFTSAGLLLGIALAAEWTVPWGDWIADQSRLAEGSARFLIAAGLLVVTTVGVGYGSAAAFAYRPGPGGRLYGALLAGLNGVVFLGFVFNYVITFLFGGDQPELIQNAYVARALASETGMILLVSVGLILLATCFGLIVRERADDEVMGVERPLSYERARHSEARGPALPETSVDADKLEPVPGGHGGIGLTEAPVPGPTMPVHVRQVRHWEREPAGASAPLIATSAWTRTWPADSVGPLVRPPWSSLRSPRKSGEAAQVRPPLDPPSPAPGSDVLRHWLRDDPESHKPSNPGDAPPSHRGRD